MDENTIPPVPFPPKAKAKLISHPVSKPVPEPVVEAPEPDFAPFPLTEEEAELGNLFSMEDMVPEDNLPPVSSWHLPGLFAAEYVDPFTVPAGHLLEQSVKVDIASMLEAERLGILKAAADVANETAATNPTGNDVLANDATKSKKD